MKIRIFAFDGAGEMDFLAPWEVFRSAAEMHPGTDVALVTTEPVEAIVAQHGLRVRPDGVFDGSADLVLVPGGGYVANKPAGIRREIARGVLGPAVRSVHRKGAVVAAVCTGTMLLAAEGMLDGRPATTHHSAIEDLRRTRALVRTNRVVDDGDIVTAGGVASGLDLAFWIVERVFGAESASMIARFMEYTPSRDIYRAAQEICGGAPAGILAWGVKA